MSLKDSIQKIRGMMGLLSEQKMISFKMDIPEDIMGIKEVFKKNGYVLYLVGGSVRDVIMGKKPKDYDLVTDAVPDDVERILKGAGYRTIPTGKAFGVINVFTSVGEYEIATMREDIGSGRRPEGVRFADIETDAKRRDLTINALYYDIDKGLIIDLVGGYEDIMNGVVRTVGNPDDRFGEDRLRIMRVIRFAARTGSELDDAVKESLSRDSSLEGISGERIRDEFIKGIQSAKSVKNFLELLDRYGLFEWIFKGLKVNRDFVDDRDVIVVISWLLVNNDIKVIQSRLNELKYTYEEIRAIMFLINLRVLTPEVVVQLKKMQDKVVLSDDQIRRMGVLIGQDSKLVDAFLDFKLTVKGDDIMRERGMKPGKELGDIINQIEFNNFLNGFTRRNIEN